MTGSRAGWKLVAAALLSLLAAALPAAARSPRPRPSWSRIGPVGAWVNAMAVTAAGRALAATADAGLFRSDDGGLSWTFSGAGLPNAEVLDVAADPADRATAYAATRVGLFRSRDGGATWSATSLLGEVDRVAIAPSSHRRLYAATNLATGAVAAWRSDDGGATWHPIGAGLHGGFSVQGLAVDAADPARVYLALDGISLFTTRDAGAHWSDESAVLPARFVDAFAADPRRAGTLYLGASGLLASDPGLYRSRDGGANWTRLPLPPNEARIGLVAASPDGALYAGFGLAPPPFGAPGLLLRSADGGSTWTMERVAEPLRQLAFDPRRPGRAFAGSTTRVLRRDAGGAWSVASGGLRAAEVTAVRADPHAPGTLYAAARIGAEKGAAIHLGLLESRNGGATWERADHGLPLVVQAKLVTSPYLPAGSLFAEAIGSLYETTNGGADWSPLAYAGYPVTDVAVAPGRPQVLFAAALLPGQCGISSCDPPAPRAVESVDGGATWIDLSGRLPSLPAYGTFTAVRIDPAHPWLVYLAGSVSYRSRDSGATWTPMPLSPDVADLALDPAFPRTLYATTAIGGKVLKSTDAGATWASASAGLPTVKRFATGELAADPATATVYLATDFGVFATRDRAASWQLLPGLPSPEVESVDADPFRPGVVYAGTAGGLFAYSP